MNKERRERLQEALDILTEVRDQEQEAQDNLPESFQGGQQYEQMEYNIDNLEEAVAHVEEVLNA